MGHIGDGVTVDPRAHVHESAYIYGKVTIGAESSVWPQVVMRTEENQAVSMPLADALALPEDVKARLGFAMDYGDGGINFFDPRPVLGDG